MTTTRRYREKMNDALYCLAVREGDVRQRLRGAYRVLCVLSLTDVPVSHRQEITSILAACTRLGPELGPDSEVWATSLEHTMRRIKNRTGRRLAERIYRLARDL